MLMLRKSILDIEKTSVEMAFQETGYCSFPIQTSDEFDFLQLVVHLSPARDYTH